MPELLSRIGLAVLHFLWQGLVLSCLGVLLLHMMARASASVRYVCALALLFMAPLVFAGTMLLARGQADAAVLTALTLEPSLLPLPARAAASEWTPPTLPNEWLARIAMLWLLVQVALNMRLTIACYRAARVARALARVALPIERFPHAVRALERARGRMGTTRRIPLLVFASRGSLALTGCFRAVILLPVSIATGLTAAQLELLLAHEIAHVWRYDYLANLCQRGIENLFFFHPGIWWLSRRIRIERELACDEAVVRAYGHPTAYGEALATLALLDTGDHRLALAASSSPLLLRIRRLLGKQPIADQLAPRWMIALATPVVLLIIGAATFNGRGSDQPSPTPSWFAEGTGKRIAYHSHRNRVWQRSSLVRFLRDDGTIESALALGPPGRQQRLVARLTPLLGADTIIAELRTDRGVGQPPRSVISRRDSDAVAGLNADSLTLRFVRESGLNATSRAALIARSRGTRALLAEARMIGNPNVVATYLVEGARFAQSAAEREQTLLEALRLRDASVDIARVFASAMNVTSAAEELAELIARVETLPGEAERSQLLLLATRHRVATAPSVRRAISRALLSLPGEDAREAIRQALRS